jgi:uncharacterized protein YcfL
MKKVFAIFAIAAIVVACNNESATSAEDAQKVADSLRTDSLNKAAEAAAKAAADTMKAATDSLKATVDSLKK